MKEINNPLWSYVLVAPQGEDDLTDVHAMIRIEGDDGGTVDIIHDTPDDLLNTVTMLYEAGIELNIAQRDGINRIIEVKGEGGFLANEAFSVVDILNGTEHNTGHIAGNAVAPPWSNDDDEENQ